MTAADLAHWSLLELAALIVGLSKTAMPAVSTLAVALFAWQLSPQAATGALVLLLLTGDAVAVATYWRHGDWRTLRRLLPAVVLGIAVGATVLAVIDEELLRRLIGVTLLMILAFTLSQRLRERRAGRGAAPGEAEDSAIVDAPVIDGLSPADLPEPAVGGGRGGTARTLLFGVLGGFTTMTSNVGGSVMSAYFLSARIPVSAFLGTAAWFFLVVNLIKLPIAIGLGFLTGPDALAMLPLVPGVLLGAWLGRRWVSRIRLSAFELIVGALTLISAVALIV